MKKFKFKVVDNILKIYSDGEPFEDLLIFKKYLEDSLNKTFKFLLYTDCIGYHSGYNCETKEDIYIGDLSEKRSFKKLKNE